MYNVSMKATDNEWIKTLGGTLYSGFAAQAGMGKRMFKIMLEETRVLRTLAAQRWDATNVCHAALDACAPLMLRLCDEPDGGWLAAVYERLCYGLFPAAQPSAPPAGRTNAIGFYITVLRAAIAHEAALRPYDPLTDIRFATEEERAHSRVPEEYAAFERAVRDAGYVETMRLAREILSFDPLSHTAGVHHVAVHMARQAAAAGIPVDVALVSAASLSHDIGKFGCRNDDAKRIPYLHYYFTDQWLQRYHLPQIAHIAANHSTWDLEFENLPIESLMLIYADFRVRGTRYGEGNETIRIHTLAEAGELIFGKLSNMDAKKRRRYSRVYRKLCDFEGYLIEQSINPDPASDTPLPVRHTDVALQNDAEAVRTLTHMAVEYNIRLMHSVSTSASFERLLERARSEKNLESIRTYLNLFDEYFTYMSREHKLLLLNFLYELLMHHESDVRRQAGKLMGRILANSGLQYRKELPEHAPETAIAPTLCEMLGQCAALWKSFLDLLIEPDPKITKRHATRICNSLKVVVGSVFDSCKCRDVRMYLAPYLRRLTQDAPTDRFPLCDSIVHVPAGLFSAEELNMLIAFAAPMLRDDKQRLQVCALRALIYLAQNRLGEVRSGISALLASVRFAGDSAAACLAAKLNSLLGVGVRTPAHELFGVNAVSELYLDNLKSAVHWVVKVANIDRLADYARAFPSDAFHVASHLSNLLLISEHLPVREHAGRALAELTPCLSVDQCNEIVVDLCRGLEAGQAEFSRYVPPCLSVLARHLPATEQEETISLLERMVRSSNARAASAALATFGAFLSGLTSDSDEHDLFLSRRSERIVGILMAGLAHFDDAVHRTAFSVLCRGVFSAESLPLSRRRALFLQINKKGLTIIRERAGNDVTFFNTAAMLNHLYRMIIDCEVLLGPFAFPQPGAAAFFPGTFDPFSSGHKRIVTEIRALGMEVYLAVDEFSWSKRTQPKLLRRQIALMSVADCAGVYLFPDDIPINIANPDDLTRLKHLFGGRQVYIVAGSDVIENASAYADPKNRNGACYMDHILFARGRSETEREKPPALERLRGQVVELALPVFYEDVSSTRIREFIDKNLEISMMVDPIVEAFIHDNSLYLRAPQYKRTMQPTERMFAFLTEADGSTARMLKAMPEAFADRMLQALRSGSGRAVVCTDGKDATASGAIYAHSINASGLLAELGSIERAEYVRMHTSGKILCIDGVACGGADEIAELANELLSNSLADEHIYALYRVQGGDDPLADALARKGFVPIGGDDERVLCVDMRAPLVITCDAFMMMKEPFASDPEVAECVLRSRKRLLAAICDLFPGELVLAYDTARINQALIRKVQQYNGVLGLPDKPRRLGPFMCVPYGKIMSDVVVPNTVTKTLHVEKVFEPDIRHFSIAEDRGYSPIPGQLAAIRSFNRPVLLVDDLLHNGYRLEKLDPLFKEADLTVKKILVGVLSGRGKDLMDIQQRDVDTVYWIPNLKYWFTETLLYPFIGGDSVRSAAGAGGALPSINLILPYKSPTYLHGASVDAKRRLCMTALRNTYEILHVLEQRHQALFTRSLTLSRLGEVLLKPRLPDKGRHARYDRSVPASSYILDDIEWMQRMGEDAWNS